MRRVWRSGYEVCLWCKRYPDRSQEVKGIKTRKYKRRKRWQMMIAAKRQRPILKHIPPLGVWVPPLVVGDPPLGGRGATPKIGFRQYLNKRICGTTLQES